MSTLTPVQMAERLKTEGEKTVEFFQSIPAEKWHEKVYTDGEHWTIHQILTHITQAEDSVIRLIAHVVGGGSGVPEDFNLDEYNHRKVRQMESETPENLIANFINRRTYTVSFVTELKQADFDKIGRHPFLGVSAVEEMFKIMYLHTQLHRRDIRKLLNL